MEWNMIATKKMRNPLDIIGIWVWVWVNTYRYIFSGMNIHLPAILGFTRYQGFDPSPYLSIFWGSLTQLQKDHAQLSPMSLHPGPTKVRISWRVSRSTQLRRIATVNTWEIRQVLFDTLMGYSTFAIGYCIILGLLGVFLCFSLFFLRLGTLSKSMWVSSRLVAVWILFACMWGAWASHVQPVFDHSTCWMKRKSSEIIKKTTKSINQPFQLFNTSTRINNHLFFLGQLPLPSHRVTKACMSWWPLFRIGSATCPGPDVVETRGLEGGKLGTQTVP